VTNNNYKYSKSCVRMNWLALAVLEC